MRGRLINPFLAEIARLDLVATAADPDGAGPLVSGFDHDFREVLRLPGGASARKEHPPVLVPCQVEVGVWEQQAQLASGNRPDSNVRLVFHFSDLRNLCLLDEATGDPLIRVNDRLVAIRRYRDRTVVQAVRSGSGGLYCTEAQPQSFGLSGGERNLLVCTFEEREQGAVA